MTDEEIIKNAKYHTCGRCRYDCTPDDKYPCVACIHGTDHRTDLWELQNTESKKKTEWILFSERLPKDYQRVLVTIANYYEHKVVRVAEYSDKFKEFKILENHERWAVGEKGLLAWTPLPKAYEEEV